MSQDRIPVSPEISFKSQVQVLPIIPKFIQLITQLPQAGGVLFYEYVPYRINGVACLGMVAVRVYVHGNLLLQNFGRVGSRQSGRNQEGLQDAGPPLAS